MIIGPAIKVLERVAKGQVDSTASQIRVLPIGQRLDTMERQALRTAPDHDIGVKQRHALHGIVAQQPTEQEHGRQSERDRYNGAGQIALVAILVQR